MKIIKLSNKTDKNKIFSNIGSTKEGNILLKDKMKLNYIYLKDIKNPASLILKQDALSIGADLIVNKDTIICKKEFSNALLIANNKQLKLLSKKEKSQPFGLKKFAEEIKNFIFNDNKKKIQIMGVINANEDSFYKNSRFCGQEAIKKIENMIENKADIIDLGAVSSRPGSKSVTQEEELSRLKPILNEIYKNKLYEKAIFSLDSYSPKCLTYALERGFKIVNDITALNNDDVAKITASYKAKIVLMHMQNNPQNMQNNPSYDNVLLDISNFLEKRIEKAKNAGINDIILDIGIGFGKTLKHNLKLIKHLEHFKSLKYPLLVGASRKSMINKIVPSEAEERLPGTLTLHLEAIKNGAEIIRCHDVKEHYQAIKVYESLRDLEV